MFDCKQAEQLCHAANVVLWTVETLSMSIQITAETAELFKRSSSFVAV